MERLLSAIEYDRDPRDPWIICCRYGQGLDVEASASKQRGYASQDVRAVIYKNTDDFFTHIGPFLFDDHIVDRSSIWNHRQYAFFFGDVACDPDRPFFLERLLEGVFELF